MSKYEELSASQVREFAKHTLDSQGGLCAHSGENLEIENGTYVEVGINGRLDRYVVEAKPEDNTIQSRNGSVFVLADFFTDEEPELDDLDQFTDRSWDVIA